MLEEEPGGEFGALGEAEDADYICMRAGVDAAFNEVFGFWGQAVFAEGCPAVERSTPFCAGC